MMKNFLSLVICAALVAPQSSFGQARAPGQGKGDAPPVHNPRTKAGEGKGDAPVTRIDCSADGPRKPGCGKARSMTPQEMALQSRLYKEAKRLEKEKEKKKRIAEFRKAHQEYMRKRFGDTTPKKRKSLFGALRDGFNETNRRIAGGVRNTVDAAATVTKCATFSKSGCQKMRKDMGVDE